MHEFFKRGHQCIGCPTEENIKKTDNKYVKENKLMKRMEINKINIF